MKDALKYFDPYIKPFRKHIIFTFICVVIAQFIVVFTPQVVSDAINELGQYIQGNTDLSQFMYLLRLLLSLAVISWVLHTIQNVIMTHIAGKSTHEMRIDLFKKLEKLPIRYFDQTNDGDILARFSSDLDNISNTLNQSIQEFVGNFVMLIITIIMMFTNHVGMSLAVLSTSPLVFLVAYIIIKNAQKYVSIQQKRIGALNGYVDEQFSGQRLIISNGLQDLSIKGFDKVNGDVYDATFKGQLYSNMLFPALMGLSLVTNAVVIFVGAWMTTNGMLPLNVAAGMLFLFTSYVRMVYQPLTQISSLYTQVQLALTGAQRIIQVMNEPEEVDRAGAHALDSFDGVVTLENVSFGYDEGTYVLHDINIDVKRGEMIALVGHTGSGKTTIMNLLNRFYDIETGAIKFDNHDIRDITLQSLRAHVGIVLQDSVLFSGTIRDNIAFGKPEATDEEVIAVAKRAFIHDFIVSLEDGYDTEVSDDNAKMSQGQKQLISIARTMLVNPNILIMDEATSNVDTVTEKAIQDAMDDVVKGRTSFVIAHRLKTILEADQIIVLQKGHIIERGSHESLLKDDGHYASLYRNQFSFIHNG